MNFYFCETCGKRVTDTDLERGAGRDKKLKGVYCSACAVGVMTVELDAINEAALKRPTPPGAKNPLPRVTSEEPKQAPRPSVRTLDVKHTPHTSGTLKKSTANVPGRRANNMPIFIGVGALVVVVFAVLIASSSSSRSKPPAVASGTPPAPAKMPFDTAAPAPAAVPSTEAKPAGKSEVAEAPGLPSAPVPARPLFEQPGEDIHESVARQKLEDIEQLWKADKLTPAQLRAKYTELTESSYKSTKAGQQAAEELRKLGPESPPTPVLARAETPAPAPAVSPAVTTPVAPPAPAAPSTPAHPAPAIKSVWWEGESAVEHNFVSHLWLAEQLDKNNLSDGKYLNQLFDEKWIRQNGKKPVKDLYAKYIVEVPADGTYTLWSREYDPFCGVLWKFSWNGGPWTSVPADYPSENKVEIGKDRALVWRNFPNQVLKKGKHVFHLAATIDGQHSIAGFDCFYLTTGTFKPDGAKKPQP